MWGEQAAVKPGHAARRNGPQAKGLGCAASVFSLEPVARHHISVNIGPSAAQCPCPYPNHGCANRCWPQALEALQPACQFYTHHLVRVVHFLGDLFVRSPFFITQDAAEAAVRLCACTCLHACVGAHMHACAKRRDGRQNGSQQRWARRCVLLVALGSVVFLSSLLVACSRRQLGERCPKSQPQPQSECFYACVLC